MATEFNYTREWTDAEAFPLLSFTKNWENPEDYPTYEPDEMQVRRDMQSLHDEVKDFLNNELIPRVIAEDATVEGWEAQETARDEAESARSEAETARAEAEQGRVDAETARVQTEAARVETETARGGAEQARVTAETGRVEAEAARVTAEQNRATVESARVTAEAARAAAESARVTTEANRESAESGRAAAEAARSSAETARSGAEAKRVSAEQARVSAEKARVDAESARTSEFATLKTKAEAATSSANTAADKVNKMTVSATDLAPGSAATVTKRTNANGGIDLKFGIPEGAQGKTGNGIESINKTGGTGAAGTYDTYTITMTDGSAFNFRVLNGANGKDGDGTGDMVADTYDPQGKRTDIFAYVEEHGGAQSDWNENDPESKAYVKNRFGGYYEKAYSVVQEETTLEFVLAGNFYEAYLPYEVTDALFGSKPVVRVVFDGVEYEKAFEKYAGFEPDETIPFGIYCDVTGDALTTIYTTVEGDTHTVEISILENTPVPINEKFLPESVKAQSDWNQNDESAPDYVKNRPFGYYEDGNRQIIAEDAVVTPYSDDYGYLVDLMIFEDADLRESISNHLSSHSRGFEGDKYVIVWNGEEFNCELYWAGVYCIGGAGYPFKFTYDVLESGFSGYILDGSESATFTMYWVQKSPVKVPEEFLPDSVKAQPDWNQNDETQPDYVKNRTHWVESEAYWTPVDSAGTTFIGETVTVSGENSLSQFSGVYQLSNCNKYRVTVDGTEYVVEATYDTNNDRYMLSPGSLTIWLTESELMVHHNDSSSSADMAIKIESYIEAVVHPLDEKFLPDAVATKPSMTRVTLSASSWDATALTQSVSVNGISADETAQTIQCSPYGASMATAVASGIYCSGQAADSLTFTCASVPTEDIQFTVSWQDCVWIVPLISFTIVSNGVYESYQAEEGMTWEEWVNSSYNTIGVSLHDDTTAVWNSDGSKYLYYLHHSVQRTEQIVSGEYKFTTPL